MLTGSIFFFRISVISNKCLTESRIGLMAHREKLAGIVGGLHRNPRNYALRLKKGIAILLNRYFFQLICWIRLRSD